MHLRDARVTEIIEGTTQVQQVLIGRRAILQGDLVD
jgi:alkylation response protein AidB-like acyl-CoA dehydrogenase